MSKIVQAVNAMIVGAHLISDVQIVGKEIFFVYNVTHKWSIEKREDGFHLWYYPGGEHIDELVERAVIGLGFDGVKMMHYFDKELGSKEAKDSFSELYTTVSEKAYGMDSILDEIITNSELF